MNLNELELDLNKVGEAGKEASTLYKEGFAYVWAGGRASHGVKVLIVLYCTLLCCTVYCTAAIAIDKKLD